jgi:hypothetical protein
MEAKIILRHFKQLGASSFISESPCRGGLPLLFDTFLKTRHGRQKKTNI